MKTCTRCDIEKPLNAFRQGRGYKDGVRSWCKQCEVEANREWRRTHPEEARAQSARSNARRAYSGYNHPDPDARARYRRKHRDSHLRRKYGITLDEWVALFDAQGGVCAGCARAPDGQNLVVDHCHKTSRVRGLLCHDCNNALGRVADNPETLRRLAAYVAAAG